jgi:hypothetical protein
MTTDVNKWAVTKRQAKTLAQPVLHEDTSDTVRFRVLSNSVRELSSEADVIEEVGKLWREAQEKFLAIGRYLVRAKEKFRGTYEAVIIPQLPFGKGVAYQLRAVAVAVDEGRLLEEELPHSYATAYQLVSLNPTDFDLARKEHLVRRDVLRREVEAFRARVRASSTERKILVRRELERLRGEVGRIERRIAELESELSQLDGAHDPI